MRFYTQLSGVLILFLSSFSLADSLIMKDGSVLMGEVIGQEKNTLKFKTSYAGTINIKWDQVKTLKSDDPVTIMLVTDELISTSYVSNIENGVSQIKKEGEDWKTAFKTDNVAFINPDPWRLGQGYKFSARVNVAIKSQHGNTIKDEFDMDGELIFRSLSDRYTFDGQLEKDTSNGKLSANNWLFGSKYDYFVSKKRYYGAVVSFERDTFTDLNLRTTVGPIAGRQHYESRELNLATDIGLMKVYENNIEESDTDYLALLWNANYDQYFFDEFTQFYHKHKGLWDWEKSQKVTLNSWTGFRFPLRHGVVASAEIEWEYDSQPNESIHKSDTTYRFKLGYQW